MHFNALYINPKGRTPRAQFIPALITLLAAMAFFHYLVLGRTPQFCLLVLLYPAFVLLARRLQDMGRSPWLLFIPLLLMLTNMIIQLDYVTLDKTLNSAFSWAALTLTAMFTLWGCIEKGKQ